MVQGTGIRDWKVPVTAREFKRESMRYFHELTENMNEDTGEYGDKLQEI